MSLCAGLKHHLSGAQKASVFWGDVFRLDNFREPCQVLEFLVKLAESKAIPR